MHSRWADPFHYNPDHQQYVPLTLCLSPTLQWAMWPVGGKRPAVSRMSTLTDWLHFLTLSEIRIPSVQSVRLQMVDPAGFVRAELYIHTKHAPSRPGLTMFHSRISTRAISVRSYATVSVQPPLRGLNSSVREKAEKLSRDWKGTSSSGEDTKNFIGGEFVQSRTTQWIDVVDPVRRIYHSPCYTYPRSRRNSPHKHSSPVFRKQPMTSSIRQWQPPPMPSKRGATQQY